MNDETQNPQDELTMLQERARTMGINPGKSGVDNLRKKIDAKLNGEPEEVEKEEAGPASAPVKTKREIEQETRDRMKREAMPLVRCRIYNLNPSKRDLQGEIVTVGNRFLGTVRKMIPFGEATEQGYHIPMIIYNELKSRKFQQVRTKKNEKGFDEIVSRMVPEYNIEVLPPLNEEELEELAVKQGAAERLGS